MRFKMRLHYLAVKKYRKLVDFRIDFAHDRLTTVLIGENGTGKSTVIEIITEIFRNIDLGLDPPQYDFELGYEINGATVVLLGQDGEWRLKVDGDPAQGVRRAKAFLPDLVFGYYSGDNNRLESLFDAHNDRYYQWVKSPEASEFATAVPDVRRLFFCRPIHGVLALITSFAFPEDKVHELYGELLGIQGFHQALFLLRKPWWAKGKSAAGSFWGAEGRPGETAKWLESSSFFPIAFSTRSRDDYRSKGRSEERYALFVNGATPLELLRSSLAIEEDCERVMFEALESLDISDMYRWVQIWLKKKDDETGEISYGQLSDGERQVLMVLGMMWLARGKNALFLLDEPDTHLNPAWQLNYLQHIKNWTKLDGDRCQVIMTTHNPLTIAALRKSEVRILSEKGGRIVSEQPYVDPIGLGFTSTLTEIFGLPSSLDPEVQKKIDVRNSLAKIEERTEAQDAKLEEISSHLARLGFMFESRDPLYDDFLKAWRDVQYADRPTRTQEDMVSQRKAMAELIQQLMSKEAKN